MDWLLFRATAMGSMSTWQILGKYLPSTYKCLLTYQMLGPWANILTYEYLVSSWEALMSTYWFTGNSYFWRNIYLPGTCTVLG